MAQDRETDRAETDKKNRIFEDLRRVQSQFPAGHVLTKQEIDDARAKGMCQPYSTINGIFNNAGLGFILEKAGLPNKLKKEDPTAKQWSRKSIEDWISAFFAATGKVPTKKDYDKAGLDGNGPDFKTVKLAIQNLPNLYRAIRLKI